MNNDAWMVWLDYLLFNFDFNSVWSIVPSWPPNTPRGSNLKIVDLIRILSNIIYRFNFIHVAWWPLGASCKHFRIFIVIQWLVWNIVMVFGGCQMFVENSNWFSWWLNVLYKISKLIIDRISTIDHQLIF
jgi:hypothetical protein